MDEKKYYYCCYTTRRKDNNSIDFWDGAFEGNITDLILKLKGYNRTDISYTNFILTFYQEITEDEYRKISGHVG